MGTLKGKFGVVGSPEFLQRPLDESLGLMHPRSDLRSEIRVAEGGVLVLPIDGERQSTARGCSPSPPGSSWCTGDGESFKTCLRDQCLTITSFSSLLHARLVIGDSADEDSHHQ